MRSVTVIFHGERDEAFEARVAKGLRYTLDASDMRKVAYWFDVDPAPKNELIRSGEALRQIVTGLDEFQRQFTGDKLREAELHFGLALQYAQAEPAAPVIYGEIAVEGEDLGRAPQELHSLAAASVPVLGAVHGAEHSTLVGLCDRGPKGVQADWIDTAGRAHTTYINAEPPSEMKATMTHGS